MSHKPDLGRRQCTPLWPGATPMPAIRSQIFLMRTSATSTPSTRPVRVSNKGTGDGHQGFAAGLIKVYRAVVDLVSGLRNDKFVQPWRGCSEWGKSSPRRQKMYLLLSLAIQPRIVRQRRLGTITIQTRCCAACPGQPPQPLHLANEAQLVFQLPQKVLRLDGNALAATSRCRLSACCC